MHRSLGTHVTEVRSCDLDTWVPSWVVVMESVGNAIGNSCWEARLPPHKKITPTVTKEARAQFIRDKYERKAYYTPLAQGTVVTTAAPVLTAAEQRKQQRLARLNANNNANVNTSSPLPSPSKQAAPSPVSSCSSGPDLFSGMTVKTQSSYPTTDNNLFAGMTVAGSSPAPPLSLSPTPSNSTPGSFDLLNLDAISQEDGGFNFSRSPVASRSQDPLAEFLAL
jgi:hypothetical protein